MSILLVLMALVLTVWFIVTFMDVIMKVLIIFGVAILLKSYVEKRIDRKR